MPKKKIFKTFFFRFQERLEGIPHSYEQSFQLNSNRNIKCLIAILNFWRRKTNKQKNTKIGTILLTEKKLRSQQ
jgi:hypothetical protein